jgi:hypothetical protein
VPVVLPPQPASASAAAVQAASRNVFRIG